MEAIFFKIKGFLGIGVKHQDIASFFRNTSDREQKKVLERIAKKANRDQKALVDSFRE